MLSASRPTCANGELARTNIGVAIEGANGDDSGKRTLAMLVKGAADWKATEGGLTLLRSKHNHAYWELMQFIWASPSVAEFDLSQIGAAVQELLAQLCNKQSWLFYNEHEPGPSIAFVPGKITIYFRMWHAICGPNENDRIGWGRDDLKARQAKLVQILTSHTIIEGWLYGWHYGGTLPERFFEPWDRQLLVQEALEFNGGWLQPFISGALRKQAIIPSLEDFWWRDR